MSNIDILRRAYAAFAAGDIPEVLTSLHEGIEWTQPAGHIYAGTFTGTDAVVEKVIAPLGDEWNSFRVEPDAFIGEGDQVAARGWLSGQYKATGVAFRARFVHWWTMTDGRATRFEAIEDTLPMAEAVHPRSGRGGPAGDR